MRTRRFGEGFLEIDHSVSPGLPDPIVQRQGLPSGAGRGVFEAATITCSHCHAVMIVNPNRQRERAWCRKCDAYVCDDCKLALVLTGDCKPMEKIIAETQELALKGKPIPIFERNFHG